MISAKEFQTNILDLVNCDAELKYTLDDRAIYELLLWKELHDKLHSETKKDFIGNTMVNAEKNPTPNLENELQV